MEPLYSPNAMCCPSFVQLQHKILDGTAYLLTSIASGDHRPKSFFVQLASCPDTGLNAKNWIESSWEYFNFPSPAGDQMMTLQSALTDKNHVDIINFIFQTEKKIYIIKLIYLPDANLSPFLE